MHKSKELICGFYPDLHTIILLCTIVHMIVNSSFVFSPHSFQIIKIHSVQESNLKYLCGGQVQCVSVQPGDNDIFTSIILFYADNSQITSASILFLRIRQDSSIQYLSLIG